MLKLGLYFFSNIPSPSVQLPSVHWRCWLGGRKGIRPIKNELGCWRDYLSGARCSCIWPSWCHCHSLSLVFLVPAHPGSPRQRAVKRLCVCVHVCSLTCDLSNRCSFKCHITCCITSCTTNGKPTRKTSPQHQNVLRWRWFNDSFVIQHSDCRVLPSRQVRWTCLPLWWLENWLRLKLQ